jgi:hypothetical protein
VFRSLINDAKSAAGALIGKYAIRASVAVPFVVAGGFATTAGTLALVERFGAVTAYLIMAGGFAVIGLFAAAAVAVKEREGAVAEPEEKQADTATFATDAATQAAMQLPLALLGTLLTTPMGPGTAAAAAKALVRNLPLVVLAALIVFLLWPSAETAEEAETAAPNEDAVEPGPGKWQEANGMDRHAA